MTSYSLPLAHAKYEFHSDSNMDAATCPSGISERECTHFLYRTEPFGIGRIPQLSRLDVLPICATHSDKSEQETAPTLEGQTESCAAVA